MSSSEKAVALAVRLPRPEGAEPCSILHGKMSYWKAETLHRLLEKGPAAVAPLREPKLVLHSHLPHTCSHPFLVHDSLFLTIATSGVSVYPPHWS